MIGDVSSVFLFIVAWLLISWPAVFGNNVCWNSDDNCIVNVLLHHSTPANQADLPIEIDCGQTNKSLEETLAPKFEKNNIKEAFLLRRFEQIQNVTLDGCHAQLNAITYGYEFLPNCGTILQAVVERFHGDNMLQFQCSNPIEMEVLVLRNNEIASFFADAFANLFVLREIYFQRNSVRHVHRSVFESLPQISVVHFEREASLNVKEGDFFANTSVADLRLIAVKHLHSDLLQHLPPSIRSVLIADTEMDNNSLIVTNPLLLRNISVINCAISAFKLSDPYSTVEYLNLSRNAIKHFESSTDVTLCALRTLDLSENKLTYLRAEWLRNLSCLQVLALHGNNLKQLSLQQFISVAPTASYVDLRGNNLEALGDTDEQLQIDCDRLRISVDHNPWNCMWLLNFTHEHPEKFRIFEYHKYISKINVNGLECRTEHLQTQHPSTVQHLNSTLHIEDDSTDKPSSTMNATTYTFVYGNGRDAKRNQRAEALIIVFMLPLGIAILFLLLYMWIYCQKMFHLSYYRSIPIIGKSLLAGSMDRFDVVRQIPPTANTTFGANHNGDYEMPLKPAASVCNCNHVGQLEPNLEPFECKKRHVHHITYEAPPNDQPHKIYEEIYADNIHVGMEQQIHPFYDHLTYVEGFKNQGTN